MNLFLSLKQKITQIMLDVKFGAHFLLSKDEVTNV